MGESRPEESIDLEAERLAYVEMVSLGFEKAVRQIGGSITHYYKIGEFTICLRFAGDALISQLTPAFAHLATEPTPSPALTICVWDSASTQTTLPLLIMSLVNCLHWRPFDNLGPRR